MEKIEEDKIVLVEKSGEKLSRWRDIEGREITSESQKRVEIQWKMEEKGRRERKGGQGGEE